jgi:erythronate-4-phosphate dehydrogenase
MNIWVDENIPLGAAVFGPHGKVTAFAGRGLRREDILGADALIVRSITKVNQALLEGTKVRFVATATIGTDHVDMAWLAKSGIGFASAPGCNANSVGDYFVAALLELGRRTGWTPEGKTLGIVGYGNVGKRVAAKAGTLGMKVLKCDPPLAEAQAAHGGAPSVDFVSLDHLLDRSDAVTLHVPLVKTGPHPTLRLADDRFFARPSRPILLLNTCRGEVVDEAALLAAKASGRLLHAVLDVFEGEPRIDPVVAAAADIITSHIAGYSVEGKVGGTFQVAEAFRAFFSLPTPALPPWPAPQDPEMPWRELPDGEFLAACVSAAYPIASDDQLLRAALREADPGRAFDRLRRDYRVRHEFKAYRVTGIPAGKRDLRSRLVGLGFRLD